MKKSLWNKFWRDKNGKVGVWERPNLLFWVWIAATVASKLINGGKIDDFLGIIAFGTIFAWAYLEITGGISYFRRLLGAVLLVAAIMNRLS